MSALQGIADKLAEAEQSQMWQKQTGPRSIL
jgi:hypothetical protein